MTSALTVIPVPGIPEVTEGARLADLISSGLRHAAVDLVDGDVLVVSSKIASKALGLVSHDPDKERVVAAESDLVVAERVGPTRAVRVVRALAGPVMAAAGVDGSNTGDRGGWLLLPRDPDAVCAALHADLTATRGVRIGVLLSDTSSRPWRHGVSDFALGAHGVRVLDDLRGGADVDGRPLEVTTRAVADEIASAADLVKGKASGIPVAVVRGLGHLLVDAAAPHPGGRDLVRTGRDDWFSHGRVEAVRAALGVEPGTPAAARVGLPPIVVGGESRLDQVGRAVRAALHGVDHATADVGPTSVTLGADSAYDLGRLTARLESALWCEWLHGEVGPLSADGVSVVVDVSRVSDPDRS